MNLQVLFICTGNTCRSPLAEVYAEQLFTGVDASFSSAGLQAQPGSPASAGTQAVARERGLSLTGHLSRRADPQDLIHCSWVIGMTGGHVARLLEIWPEEIEGKVGLLGVPGVDLRRRGMVGGGEDVADPCGGNLLEYRIAADQIERLVSSWSGVFGPLTSRKDVQP